MTATIHLVSNSAASTCRFWSAIFDAPAVLDRPGRWRIVGPEGFAVTVTEAAVVEAITRVDLTVTAAPGAPERLRALGFEVSMPGWPLCAVDTNGTDSTVWLTAMDPFSPDFYEDDPTDAEKARIAALASGPPDAVTAPPTRLSLMVIYAPEPRLEHAARFYGAVLDVEPVREQHGTGPEHWSVTRSRLTIELYPAGSGLPTRSRFEFVEDAEAAVERLRDRAHASPERTRDGRGWRCLDPIGNTVILVQDDGRYFEGMSRSVEARDYAVAGPLEWGPASQDELEWLDDDGDNVVERP